ncbi:MAG: hypothetical protein K8R88_10440 [Armatimonadetes bacterium]|nr:hypothetical protein [Armatimonadota bacterium]
MRLKVITTASMITGLILLFMVPQIVGPRPPTTATRVAKAQFGLRYLEWFGATAFFFLLAAFLSILIIRQARKEILEDIKTNFTELVEGSLKDHEPPKE